MRNDLEMRLFRGPFRNSGQKEGRVRTFSKITRDEKKAAIAQIQEALSRPIYEALEEITIFDLATAEDSQADQTL